MCTCECVYNALCGRRLVPDAGVCECMLVSADACGCVPVCAGLCGRTVQGMHACVERVCLRVRRVSRVRYVTRLRGVGRARVARLRLRVQLSKACPSMTT